MVTTDNQCTHDERKRDEIRGLIMGALMLLAEENTEATIQTLAEVLPRAMRYSRWYNTRENDFITDLCNLQISEDEMYYLCLVAVNGEIWRVRFGRMLGPEPQRTLVRVSK